MRIKNLTKRLVIVPVGRTNVHLGAGETSASLDPIHLSTNSAVAKLVKTSVVAVMPETLPPPPPPKRKPAARRKKPPR